MTNAELIKALRICANQTCCDNCPRYDIDHTQDAQRCCIQLINDAADALEAANKTVIPHRNYERCHIYWCECGWFLRNKDQTPNYCPNCGKRIEWESAE